MVGRGFADRRDFLNVGHAWPMPPPWPCAPGPGVFSEKLAGDVHLPLMDTTGARGTLDVCLIALMTGMFAFWGWALAAAARLSLFTGEP